MSTFAHNGVDLYYEVRGEGRPVMLVAGLAGDSAFWLPVVDALAARFQVVLIDNRGCGRTTPLDAPTGIGVMADDCVALADHLALPKFSVVGHSMGGMIAQDLAIRHAARVERVVLAATAAVDTARNADLFGSWVTLFTAVDRALWFRNLFYWVFSARFFDNAKTVDAIVQLATNYPYQQTATALRNQVQAIAGFDARSQLSALRARTLVLAGTEDALFPIAAAAAFAKAIPHATFVPVEGSAHSIPNEFPQEFLRRVTPFLAAAPAR